MATRRRTNLRYDSYGSVAYAPVYDGSAVRTPRREEEELYSPAPPQPRRSRQPRQQELRRTHVQVREAGAVAPFAIIGFLAVAVFAVMLLFSHAQSTVLNAEVVSLRAELSTLNAEHAKLSAQYEKEFDMDKIQAAVGATMTRPTSDQAVYLDLSEPDSVTVYSNAQGSSLTRALSALGETLSGMIEYFR